MFDFTVVKVWIHKMLTSIMPETLAIVLECFAIGIILILIYAIIAVIMIYMERKVCGAFQCRLGPNRLGPWGAFQLFADMIKMLTKEVIEIKDSDKFLYNLAPYIVSLASLLAFACVYSGVQCGNILSYVRVFNRSCRHPPSRMELEQQVLPYRCDAKRRADGLVRTFGRYINPYYRCPDGYYAVLGNC